MSTESLFHNFVIDTPEDAERFVEAILLSEKDPPFEPCCNIKYPTDPEEIRSGLERIFSKVE